MLNELRRKRPSSPITVLTASPSAATATSGQSFALTYQWSGGPTSQDYKVFVHFLGTDGQIAFGDDHFPPSPTSSWTGSTSYTRNVSVPTSVAAGTYQIAVGLYLVSTGARLALTAGTGVVDLGSNRYQVGTVSVSGTVTPPPPDPEPTPTTNTEPNPPLSQRVIKRATNYGVRCDGVTDDTTALQNAVNALAAGEALELPAGTCMYSNVLHVEGRTNLVIYGQGASSTIFKAKNLSATQWHINNSNSIFLQDFQVYAPGTTARVGGNTRGVYTTRSGDVHLIRLQIVNVPGSGFNMDAAHDSSIENCEVIHSWSDAFHITGGAYNITYKGNHAADSGDDCFASIGYNTALNKNISFLDNACEDGNASGVSFEGTIGGKAYRNVLTRTGVAGIRIDSQNAWSTGIVSTVDVVENRLVNVRTSSTDHAAVMIYTDREEVKYVTLTNNVIENPNTWSAIRIFALNGASVHDVSVQNNQVTDVNRKITDCIAVGSGTSALTISGNTLNGGACN